MYVWAYILYVSRVYLCVYMWERRKRVTSSRAVYVNETVARRMSYRYYFYRSSGNFAPYHATSLYWREVREKWREMHYRKITFEESAEYQR